MYVSLEMAKFTMTLSTAGLKADRLVSLYDWKYIRMLVFFNHQMLIATSTSSQSQKNKIHANEINQSEVEGNKANPC